jgi:hypothetical protein
LNNEYYVNKLVADAVEKAFKSEKWHKYCEENY